MTVGVAISTHQRPDVLARALAGWAQFMPDVLIVNHDVNDYNVATTKNRGIAMLMDAGVEDQFYADDDVWPITPNWANPYITSGEPHLMHVWGARRFIRNDPDRGVSVWSWPRGVLLYVRRHVVEQVGGMRPEFHNAGEHVEWSRRIHNAGFTAHPFQDAITARGGIWHCEDYTRCTPSSLPAQRYSPEETQHRHELYERFRNSTDYVDYRARTTHTVTL